MKIIRVGNATRRLSNGFRMTTVKILHGVYPEQCEQAQNDNKEYFFNILLRNQQHFFSEGIKTWMLIRSWRIDWAA